MPPNEFASPLGYFAIRQSVDGHDLYIFTKNNSTGIKVLFRPSDGVPTAF